MHRVDCNFDACGDCCMLLCNAPAEAGITFRKVSASYLLVVSLHYVSYIFFRCSGISAVQFTTFAEPLKVADLEDNFEISEKVDISNGGNEAKGEVASNHSHPDQ